MAASLSEFLRKYHTLSANEDNAKIQRLFMLAELHPLTAVWQSDRYATWKVFLRVEQLCPAPLLDSFEEAMGLFKKPLLERIGADAAVVLARAEPHLREGTLKAVNEFIKAHGMRPKQMKVWAFVRALRKTIIVTASRRAPAKSRKPTTAYATRH